MGRYSLFIFSLAFFFCVVLSVIVNLIYGVDVVYTHLFYIPIIISGIWYPRQAVFIAAAFGAIHIICDYLSMNTLRLSPFLRSGIFIIVAFVISRITLERNRYYSELEMLNNAMCDVVTRIDTDGIIEYISPSVERVLGYKSEELNGRSYFDLIHHEEIEAVKDGFKKAVETKTPFVLEHRVLCSNGDYLWVESIGTPMSGYKEGIEVYVFGSKDITLRKKAEEELKYLTVHDPLTGLYNRLMFEEELKRLKTGRYDPVGIIICDIDGLKVINDNLGHSSGDILLIAAANLLKEQCRSSDILARIGGDEFAILIQECSQEMLNNVYNRIRRALDESYVHEIGTRLYMSIGCASGNTRDISINEILKEADERMYNEKAQNRKFILSKLEELINSPRSRI